IWPPFLKNRQLDRRSCRYSQDLCRRSLTCRNFHVAGAADDQEQLAWSELLVIGCEAVDPLESHGHFARPLQGAREVGCEKIRDQVSEAVDSEDRPGPAAPCRALGLERLWAQVVVDRLANSSRRDAFRQARR